MQYNIEDIILGEVTGIEDYGIFIRIDDNHNGLIHISEITDGFVNNISDFVEIGEKIYVRILEIDENTNHMKLSIKNINYKENGKTQNIPESLKGFLPLQENLERWTNDKLKEFEEETT